MACPCSVLGKFDVESESAEFEEAAAIGTLVHKIVAEKIAGETHRIDEECAKAGLSVAAVQDVGFLTWRAMDMLDKEILPRIGKTEEGETPKLFTELSMGGGVFESESLRIILTGTADLGCQVGADAFVVDWKSGRGDIASYAWQMKGYAIMAQEATDAEFVTVITVGLRDGEFIAVRYSRGELDEARKEISFAAVQLPNKGQEKCYRTGQHCQWCKGKTSCPARKAHQAEMLSMFGAAAVKLVPIMDKVEGSKFTGLTEDEAEFVIGLHTTAASIERAMKSVRASIKQIATVCHEAGIPLESQHDTMVVSDRTRASIDASDLINALVCDEQAVLASQAIIKNAALTKPKTRAVMKAAELDKDTIDGIMERLDDNGQIKTNAYQVVSVKAKV